MEDYEPVEQVSYGEEEKKDIGADSQEDILKELKPRKLKIKLERFELDREFIRNNVGELMNKRLCSEYDCDKVTHYVHREYTKTLCKLHFKQVANSQMYFSINEVDSHITHHLDRMESYFVKSKIISTYLKKYIDSDQILTCDIEKINALQDKMSTDIVKLIEIFMDDKKPKDTIALHALQNFEEILKKRLYEIIKIVGVQVFEADITQILTEILSIHHQRKVNVEEDRDLYSLDLYQKKFTLKGVQFIARSKFDSLSEKFSDLEDQIEKLIKRKEKLKKQLRRMERENKSHISEIETLPEKNNSELRTTSQNIYKSVKGEDAKMDDQFELHLFMSNSSDCELISGLKSNRLPQIKRISVGSIPVGGHSDLNTFLANTIPTQLKLLLINWGDVGLVDGSKYVYALSKAVKGVTKEVWIDDFDFKVSEVESIVKSSHKCKRLIFLACKLPQTGSYSFSSSSSYAITYLSFMSCGNSHSNEWEEHPERIERIVSGICKCSLKHSLKQLNVNRCGVTKEEVQQMFTDRGVDVQVTDDEVDPLSD